MSYKIDFNCDMGESFGMYKMGFDEEVIKYISSANIACGFHAGDPMWMRRTVVLAESHGVAVGAHPSYPDLNGFGRRNLSADPEEVRNDVVYQASALLGFTDLKMIQHVKPHGAMYNQAVDDKAEELVEGDLKPGIDFRQTYTTMLEDHMKLDAVPVVDGTFEKLGFIGANGA